jgi:hypothetical protein
MLRVWSDWIDYDRFYRGGMWRQQGVDADAVLAVRPFDEVAIRGILAKNRGTDYFFTPDRLLGAWEAVGTRDSLRIGYRGVSLFDVPTTAQFSKAATATTVHTLNGSGPLTPHGSWGAEAGLSHRSHEGLPDAPGRVGPDRPVPGRSSCATWLQDSAVRVPKAAKSTSEPPPLPGHS